MAKANYQPYGIDFPAGPTGRFTNGRNIGDIIGMQFTLFYINWCMLLSHKFFFFNNFLVKSLSILKYLISNIANLKLMNKKKSDFGSKS